jgi:multiple antibiotic resistance protein
MEYVRPYLLAFVPLFVAIDAVAVVPSFLALTEEEAAAQRARTLRLSVVTGLLAGLGFLVLGRGVFRLLGVTIADFQVAGGAVLFAISVTDLIAPRDPRLLPGASAGVVPLGVPLLVGPAVLTTLLSSLNSHGILVTLVAFVVNMLVAWAILSRAGLVTRVLGLQGTRGFAKVMSLLMAAIGVTMVRRGIEALLSATTLP